MIAAVADLNGRIGVVSKLIEGDRSVGLDHQLVLLAFVGNAKVGSKTLAGSSCG